MQPIDPVDVPEEEGRDRLCGCTCSCVCGASDRIDNRYGGDIYSTRDINSSTVVWSGC